MSHRGAPIDYDHVEPPIQLVSIFRGKIDNKLSEHEGVQRFLICLIIGW